MKAKELAKYLKENQASESPLAQEAVEAKIKEEAYNEIRRIMKMRAYKDGLTVDGFRTLQREFSAWYGSVVTRCTKAGVKLGLLSTTASHMLTGYDNDHGFALIKEGRTIIDTRKPKRTHNRSH